MIQQPHPPSADVAFPDAVEERTVPEFLAFHGGPFFALQERLGLIHDRTLQTGRRIALFVTLAWGIPLLLTLPSLLTPTPVVTSYLKDLGPGTRFLVAVAAFITAEQMIESRLKRGLWHFTQNPLIAPQSLDKCAEALVSALQRRDSAPAEYACLALAILAGVLAYASFNTGTGAPWAVTAEQETHHLTAAGWWCVCVSIPVFTFLLLRGVWRHIVWASLLRDIARLQLRLVSTHPDGKGGLAFVGNYPNAYALFVFGVSCGVAAAVSKHLAQADLSATTLTMIMAAWLLLVVAFFACPLTAFSKPLSELKARSLQALSAQATLQHRAAERKAIGRNIAAPGADAKLTSLEAPDVAKAYEQTRKLATMLVNRGALLPVASAALLPFAVIGARHLPFKEVLSVLKKLLLL